jgi:nitroreductase
MEVKEVIGNRRTIRFYLPFRPVERDKVQKMLEAARRASCVGNVNNARAIVVWKDQASPELIETLTPPLGYQQMQTASCFIVWCNETMAYEVDKWIKDLRDLAKTGRIGMGMDVEATEEQVDRLLRPAFTPIWKQAAVAPLAYMDVGQAVAQATLVAYDEGLGTCLMSGPRMLERVSKLLKLPETMVLVCVMSVGYPAESREAGGQTLRAPFESLFFEMEYGKPFKPDPGVEEELKQARMIQEPAPLPWRGAELAYLAQALGLGAGAVKTTFDQGPQASSS